MSEAGYERPQWMEARFKSVLKLPDCGRKGTHSACSCFIKKIIELEEQLVIAREKAKKLKIIGVKLATKIARMQNGDDG